MKQRGGFSRLRYFSCMACRRDCVNKCWMEKDAEQKEDLKDAKEDENLLLRDAKEKERNDSLMLVDDNEVNEEDVPMAFYGLQRKR